MITDRQIQKYEKTQIKEQRLTVARGITGVIDTLIVGVGQCSTNIRDIDITKHEAEVIRALNRDMPGVFVMQRQNHRKPRSPRDDGTLPWRGMDTSHPEEAFELHLDTICSGTPICSELLSTDQVTKYADGLSMAWVGARNDDKSFALNLTIVEPTLPLGLKNDLTGSNKTVKQTLDLLQRADSQYIAPSFLIDRGGTKLYTPDLWEQHILTVLDETEGKFMLDLAHGTEQAHDPAQNFAKSVEAQERALDHYIQIGERTGMWARGILLEASDAPSDTDPNMPLKIALEGITHIVSSMLH